MNVKKVDENGNGLPNAVFGVYNNTTDAENEDNEIIRLTTGADGVSQTFVKEDTASKARNIIDGRKAAARLAGELSPNHIRWATRSWPQLTPLSMIIYLYSFVN